MRTSSEPKSRDGPARQKVQGYLATNIAVPGLGSLVGGRKVGALQMALYLSGFTITVVLGLRFVYWSLAHWSEYHGPNAEADPIAAFAAMWQHARWPFLGVAMCIVAWLWALQTSRSLAAEKKMKAPPVIATVHER